MNTIQAQWDTFRALVVPIDAHPIQVQEMRRAFYAGAEATIRVLYAIGDDSVTEDGGVAMIEGLHEECRIFAAQVGLTT